MPTDVYRSDVHGLYGENGLSGEGGELHGKGLIGEIPQAHMATSVAARGNVCSGLFYKAALSYEERQIGL